jgi:hypothetical protein
MLLQLLSLLLLVVLALSDVKVGRHLGSMRQASLNPLPSRVLTFVSASHFGLLPVAMALAVAGCEAVVVLSFLHNCLQQESARVSVFFRSPGLQDVAPLFLDEASLVVPGPREAFLLLRSKSHLRAACCLSGEETEDPQ